MNDQSVGSQRSLDGLLGWVDMQIKVIGLNVIGCLLRRQWTTRVRGTHTQISLRLNDR